MARAAMAEAARSLGLLPMYLSSNAVPDPATAAALGALAQTAGAPWSADYKAAAAAARAGRAAAATEGLARDPDLAVRAACARAAADGGGLHDRSAAVRAGPLLGLATSEPHRAGPLLVEAAAISRHCRCGWPLSKMGFGIPKTPLPKPAFDRRSLTHFSTCS